MYGVKLLLYGLYSPIRKYRFASISGLFLLAALPVFGASPSTYTRVSDIRTLSPEVADRGLPVHLQGVITDAVPAPDFFLQDKTAGIYVEGNKTLATPHHLGDLIDIIGVTGPGRFAPVVKELSFTVIGRGRLPRSRIFDFSEVASGHMDSQWIQIRGMIRSASSDHKSWPDTTIVLTVDSGAGQFRARVPVSEEAAFPLSLVGTEVLFSGVCGTLFNNERQLVGILLYIPALEYLQPQTAIETVPISQLLRFSPLSDTHRARVQGIVTYRESDTRFFMQSEGKGLRVLAQQTSDVSAGDLIQVIGFPAVGESAPVLTSASVIVLRHTSPPVPIKMDVKGDWQRYDGALVTTEAEVVQTGWESGESSLSLRHDGVVFSATLTGSQPAFRKSIPPGSSVLVQGICLVRNGGMWRTPQSFRIVLRSMADVQILHAPSFWSLRHLGWMLAAALGGFLIAGAWLLILKRRFELQVASLKEKLRRGAVIAERNRIARELHDTLEQDLAGITLHLDLAADCFEAVPSQSRRALETARRMSRRSMIEARRSVWDLRSHLLEKGSLSSAIFQAVEPLRNGSQTAVEFSVHGKEIKLTQTIEMNVLRIAQEAVTNALRHAGADKIEVELEYSSQTLTLSVEDNGSGFDDRTALLARGSHFGLLDMKERAQAIGSKFAITSIPGKGTAIEVIIPINTAHASNPESATHSYSGS